MAAERRAKTHFGREHPIAGFRLAGVKRSRYCRGHVERERREGAEYMKLGWNHRRADATDERGLQRETSGSSRRILMRRGGRISFVVVRLRRLRAVTSGMFRVAVADTKVAMRRAKHQRSQPNAESRRRNRAENGFNLVSGKRIGSNRTLTMPGQ